MWDMAQPYPQREYEINRQIKSDMNRVELTPEMGMPLRAPDF